MKKGFQEEGNLLIKVWKFYKVMKVWQWGKILMILQRRETSSLQHYTIVIIFGTKNLVIYSFQREKIAGASGSQMQQQETNIQKKVEFASWYNEWNKTCISTILARCQNVRVLFAWNDSKL